MDTQNKSGEHSTEVAALESTLQLYERAHDVLIATLWDDEQARELVSAREPKLMLELIVSRVKALRMESRTLRLEVHELEDAEMRRLRRETGA